MGIADYITGAIALGALIVSIVALVRSTPVPRWVVEDQLEEDAQGVWHRVEIVNRGSGAAGDVSLRSLYTGDLVAEHETVLQHGRLEARERVPSNLLVSLQNPLLPSGVVGYRLEWRQAPREHKRKRKEITPSADHRRRIQRVTE